MRPCTRHILMTGSHVWARKRGDGGWHPATVLAVGVRLARLAFESGWRSSQPFSQLFPRNPRLNGKDCPS